MNLSKIPQPFYDFIQRSEYLKSELFHDEVTVDKITDLLYQGRGSSRKIYNYFFSLLAPGTLFMRFGAIILTCRYLRSEFETNPDSVLNRQILTNLKDTLPTDTNWRNLWEACSRALGEKGVIGSLIDLSDKSVAGNNVLTSFVSVRNRVVHQEMNNSLEYLIQTSNATGIYKSLTFLEGFMNQISVFEGCSFIEKSEEIFFHFNDEILSLSPFVKVGKNKDEPMDIPYIFQGIYKWENVIKFLGTSKGEEIHVDEDQLNDEFLKISKNALSFGETKFDFTGILDRYNKCFVGRDSELNDLYAFCLNKKPEYNFTTVYGPAGFGKSALLGALVDKLKENDIPALFHFCGAGERNNPMNILVGLINTNKNLWNNSPTELKKRQKTPPGNWDKLVELFHDTLQNYIPTTKNEDKNLVIIIDGVDESAVAFSNPSLTEIFYQKKKDGENEISEKWNIPHNIRIIFGYREGFYGTGQAFENIETVQPLRALNEGAVDEMLSKLEAVTVSKEVKEKIIHYGTIK